MLTAQYLTVLTCSSHDIDKQQQQDPVDSISWVLCCMDIPLVLISTPFLPLLVNSDNIPSSEEEILLQ